MYGRPRMSDFDVTSRSHMHVYIQEENTYAPIPILMLFAFVLPLLQMIIIGLYVTKIPLIRKLWDLQSIFLTVLGATSTQLLFVCIVKNIAAKPKPDLIRRCNPMTFNQPLGVLSTVAICQTTRVNLLLEGFRSFPSGHASTIFTTATIQMLFSSARLNLFDGRGSSFKVLSCIILQYSTAFIISFSRVSDNRHFIEDVLFGMIIGIVFGTLFYSLYFPLPWQLGNLGRSYYPRRFNLKNLFHGVGGFWKLPDLPGSYAERVGPEVVIEETVPDLEEYLHGTHGTHASEAPHTHYTHKPEAPPATSQSMKLKQFIINK